MAAASEDDPVVPGLPSGEDSYRLPVAAVARRLGIAPATLRTWDRRYGLGPSAHQAGAHRRYTPDDLSRLSRMRRLTLEGMGPAEAARLVLAGESEDEPGVRARAQPSGRLGGGTVLALPGGAPAVRGLARAAMALDSPGCLRVLREELQARGVVSWWDEVVVPVLIAVGNRFQATGKGIEVEHLLSECVLGVVRGTFDDPLTDGPSVLLASAEDDAHALPVHVLAAALTLEGIAVRLLGARMPGWALASAVRRSGPAAVFLWSSLRRTADLGQLSSVPAMRPAPRILLGGPGWDPADVPPGVVLVGSLGEAVEGLISATGR
jgi:DNA-binding transcriptional MerR regulator